MRKILRKPFFYSLYQQIIGCNKYLKRLTTEYIKPFDNCEILEIGCATGNIIKYLEKNTKINYTGIDIFKKYIKYSKKKFPKYQFICEYINNSIKLNKYFDIIIMEAVISGCKDECVIDLLNFIKNHSNKETRIIISDTNYKTTSRIKKFLYDHERNSYMRTKDKLINILDQYFVINKITEINNPYFIPYEKIIFECKNIK